jgi:hypothetical protein
MTANFVHAPSLSPIKSSSPSHFLLEPLLVVGSAMFWILVLPLGALFCAGVALYDWVAALSTRQFRFPLLRSHLRLNPLMLRQKLRRRDEQPTPAESVQQPIGA